MNVCACLLLLTFAIIPDRFTIIHAKSTKRFKDPSKYVKCAEKSKTLWPDYRDRKFYYECLGDDYYARRPCPPKKVFNYRKQQCIFPEINDHKSRKKEKFAPSCLEPSEKMLWPDPVKPRDYYKCTGVGKYQRLHCPFNEIFEFSVQMCVVEPDEVIATAPNYHNSVENGPQCLKNEIHLAWPSTLNQQIYYLCTGFGVFEQRECAIGSIFNFLMQSCVPDERQLSTTTTSTTSTITTTTSTEPSTTIATSSTTPSTTTEIMTNEIEYVTETTATQPEYPSTSTTEQATTSISPVIYPAKIKCLICWRPTCDVNELSMKWPDYDSPTRFFECLKKNVIILKKCRINFVFSFELQRCVMN